MECKCQGWLKTSFSSEDLSIPARVTMTIDLSKGTKQKSMQLQQWMITKSETLATNLESKKFSLSLLELVTSKTSFKKYLEKFKIDKIQNSINKMRFCNLL